MHQLGHPGHVLRVPAIDMNNNTEFGCTIYLASKIISSQYCYLKIQDNNETTMVLDKKKIVCIAGLQMQVSSNMSNLMLPPVTLQ